VAFRRRRAGPPRPPAGSSADPRCNLCGGESFTDVGPRVAVQCAACGSLERTRLIKLVIDERALVRPDTRVLHLAPEPGLAGALERVAGTNCRFADLDPTGFPDVPRVERLDLCRDLERIADGSFDLIVHSHVLEHVPCNYTYVLFHLHRLLSDAGTIVCCIPFLDGHYESSTSPGLTAEERTERFGQWDHVRRFGTADLDLSLGRVYELPPEYDARHLVPETALRAANVPPYAWTGFTPHSVLVLGKLDYRLR
jgi:phosphoglycolate phosphatase